jgi:methionine-rich copper-binding protein CopC
MTSAKRFRRLAILAVAITAPFLLPSIASAHAELVRAIPADGATVTERVTFVSGRYSEDLAADSSLLILDSTGATIGRGGVDPDDDRVMIARPDAPLTSGTFTVRSTAISREDGHPERVTWTFTVDVPASPSPTPVPSGSAPPPSSEPTATPTLAPTAAPTASPPPADQTASPADLVVPIVAALALVTIGAGFLVSRGRRP